MSSPETKTKTAPTERIATAQIKQKRVHRTNNDMRLNLLFASNTAHESTETMRRIILPHRGPICLHMQHHEGTYFILFVLKFKRSGSAFETTASRRSSLTCKSIPCENPCSAAERSGLTTIDSTPHVSAMNCSKRPTKTRQHLLAESSSGR